MMDLLTAHIKTYGFVGPLIASSMFSNGDYFETAATSPIPRPSNQTTPK
jgi:hypothetical protein